MWVDPQSTGNVPPPCNTFTMTSISRERAVVFGGRISNDVTSDIYIANFTSNANVVIISTFYLCYNNYIALG